MRDGDHGRDALPLHVERSGTGPPLVLLHGFGANGSMWRHWIPDLSRDHEVFVIDLKGFGAAPKPSDGRYGPTDMAESVHLLLRRESLDGVTLIGHSWGGAIALLVALRLVDRQDARLHRLVIVDGATSSHPVPPLVSLARRRGPWVAVAFRLLPKRPLMRHILRSIVYDSSAVDEEQVAAYADPLRSVDAQRALLRAAAQIVPDNVDELVPRLRDLAVPTLVLWGRHDPVFALPLGERLARDLPRARLAVLDRCGHIPPEERPDESLRIVCQFLGSDAVDAPPAAS